MVYGLVNGGLTEEDHNACDVPEQDQMDSLLVVNRLSCGLIPDSDIVTLLR